MSGKDEKLMGKRAMIFIDGNNFYHGLKTVGLSTKIDFRKFVEKTSTEYNLIKTYYYNSPYQQQADPTGYKNQQKFFDYIRSLPRFELILGRLEKRIITIPDQIYERIKDIHPKKSFETLVEKGVDVNIAVDMLKFAFLNYYDVAILVSGDGDFVPVVKSVQELGKKVINAYFKDKERKGFHLIRTCDIFIEINGAFIKECQYKRKTQG